MTLAEIKTRLRDGAFAFPGGYPLYFITSDGAVLSFEAVRSEWRCVVDAHLRNDRRCGWHIADCDVNWENSDLYCEHTSKRINSAYAEDEAC